MRKGPAQPTKLEDPEGIDAWEAMKLRAPPMSPEDEEGLRRFMARIDKPTGSADPRRHHFIPQFFLKRFATNEQQIAVVPLTGDNRRLTHVSGVAVMKDLYTIINTDFQETVAVERILAEADSEAAAVIARLVGGAFPPSAEDRASLAIWLALLSVRDPKTRRTLEALFDQTYKMDLSLAANPEAARARLRENLEREPTNAEVADLVEAANDLDSFEVVPHQNDLVKHMLDMALSIYPHLLRRHYVMVRFAEPALVLSDRPLLLYQRPENRNPRMGVGFINADELWLPLSRKEALILHNDPSIGELIYDAPGEVAHEFNQAVVWNAASEVYCHPDELQRLNHLEFPTPNRPLMQMTGGDWMKSGTDGINDSPQRRRHRRYRRDT